IPKRGYRFVAGVREVWAEDTSQILVDHETLSPHVTDSERQNQNNVAPQPNGKPSFGAARSVEAKSFETDSPPKHSPVSRFVLPMIFLASGAVVALGIWFLMLRPVSKAPASLLEVTPVTSYLGNEDQTAFSPDGRQIAFVWNGEKED